MARKTFDRVRPLIDQKAEEIQAYGSVVPLPLGLSQDVCSAGCDELNQLLADTITLRDLYKKHHWQLVGPTFYPLHKLLDKHYEQQAELVDAIAERIQILGGVSVAMAHDVVEISQIPRAPRGRESVPVQLSRLLHAHEMILEETRSIASRAEERGDLGTNDLLISGVLRTNEMQVWFLASHLVDEPLVKTESEEKVHA